MNDERTEAINALKEGFAHVFPAHESHNIAGKPAVGIYYGDNKPEVFIEMDRAFSILIESDLSRDQIIDALWLFQLGHVCVLNEFLRRYDELLALNSLTHGEDSSLYLNF